MLIFRFNNMFSIFNLIIIAEYSFFVNFYLNFRTVLFFNVFFSLIEKLELFHFSVSVSDNISFGGNVMYCKSCLLVSH